MYNYTYYGIDPRTIHSHLILAHAHSHMPLCTKYNI